MTAFNLEPGEIAIDTWTMVYSPPKGGRYNGKLMVTNRRLLYDARFDVGAAGLIEEALFYKSGSEGYVAIPKDRIRHIEVKKSFFAKRVIVTLDNGQEHLFSYGMLDIDPVAEAIRRR